MSLLEIKNLETAFRIGDEYFNAVDHITLDLQPNEVLAIVGESGCGKSTLATTVMGLHNENFTKSKGEVIYNNQNLLDLSEGEMSRIRTKEIGMIFQDPLSSLNPLQKIGRQIEEALVYHTDLNKSERDDRVIELLSQVGIPYPERCANQYPHELSGGMRQRVMIAMALSCKPNIIIADEPTTALDVTIQAQILDLLKELQAEMEAGIILITHDLGVVAEMADRVAVLYAGQVIEIGSVSQIFKNPQHPYTKSLLKSIPNFQEDSESDDLYVIDGMVPSLKNLKRTGCRFAERIRWISPEAHEADPVLHDLGDGHQVRCTCYQTFYFKEDGVQ
ncbi:ABC transporter ATP-binding protein [Streptococcus sp. WM07]|uniref:ABC transporter ATP-binding protein n=1 Tax=unclassified Streptococcus TaxID=2608887 RepID=UPI0010727328|nr:ABC transporter ATP-binding protein [Streptococcus sp. WM07]MBF0805792.1 ABC transporter ATP-binding protein [Streptococcus sp. 19428wA2_WM07]TFU28642.1 ABC transporter ATP-binding protein [Streptococcus sp. WM07]